MPKAGSNNCARSVLDRQPASLPRPSGWPVIAVLLLQDISRGCAFLPLCMKTLFNLREQNTRCMSFVECDEETEKRREMVGMRAFQRTS